MNNIADIESGFDTDGVLTMSVTHVVDGDYADFHRRALESVSAIPGVERVAFAWGVPLTGNSWQGNIDIEGRVAPTGSNELLSIPVRSVSPDYFELLGQSIVEGRGFRTSDDGQSLPVAVVNQTFVDRYLDESTAIGTRFTRRANSPTFEVVGVVNDSRTEDLTRGAQPEVYLSFWQAGAFSKHLVVRTAGDPGSIGVAVQQALRAVAPTVAVENIQTLDQIRGASLASRTFAMQLLVSFAVVACILTLAGIYGMLSLSVTSRRREIAIRTAMGAEKHNVLRLVLREGVLVIAVGVTAGLVAATGLSRVLGAFLFEVEATDPATLLVMGSLFAAVALLACWVPARRAAEADPVSALREE
jgi:putative ABC transport system permease protein